MFKFSWITVVTFIPESNNLHPIRVIRSDLCFWVIGINGKKPDQSIPGACSDPPVDAEQLGRVKGIFLPPGHQHPTW